MWNRILYAEIIKKIARQGILDGNKVNTKEDVYKYLSEKLFVSYHTVKGWTRAASHGPGDKETLKNLEKLFGVSLEIADTKKEKGDTVMGNRYSDFVKRQIMECYTLMKDYLRSENVEDENTYCEMRSEMDKRKIAIPKSVYEKITNFANEHLDPIIYDEKNTFASLYTEDIGYYDKKGVFHTRSEEKTIEFCGRFLDILLKIEQELDDFAMKELYPILIDAEH